MSVSATMPSPETDDERNTTRARAPAHPVAAPLGDGKGPPQNGKPIAASTAPECNRLVADR